MESRTTIYNKFDKILQNTKTIKDPTDPDYMRYNNFSLFISVLSYAMLASTILTAIQKQWNFLPISIALLVIAFAAAFTVRKYKLPKKVFLFVIYFLEIGITIASPVIYITSGGIKSSTTIWFFLVLILSIIILDGVSRVVFYILQLVVYLGVVALDYNGLITVSGELSRFAWYLSLYAAVPVVSLAIAVFIFNQINELRQGQERISEELKDTVKQKEDIERLTAELEQQKAIAERALNTQKEFISNMNHEVRTPLNTVIGLAEIVSRVDDIDEVHNLTYAIRNAANGVGALVEDILEYSATGDLKPNLKLAPYHTEALLGAFRNICVPALEKKGIAYEVRRDAMPTFLLGDITRIQQILHHLFSNAVKFTNEGKVIYRVNYNFEKQELTICVEDTGIGIDTDDLPYIFDPFKRTEDSEHKHTTGIGIGLTLTKKIVDSMHGDIYVQSGVGKGSVFTVVIPQKETKMEGNPMGGPVAPGLIKNPVNKEKTGYDFRGKKLMFVDSTMPNHLIFDRMIIDTGIFSAHENDPKEIVNQPSSKLREFDIFIIDYNLPSIDGAQLLMHMRTKGIKAPVICMSNDINEGNKEEYLSKGFAGCLSKPLNRDELLATIDSLINK